MLAKTAVLLGATGLIGNHLLQLLLNSDHYNRVRVIVRKPITITHTKLEVLVVDFNKETEYPSAVGNGDVIFCCIGTTMKNVKGDKVLYKQIDYDIPVKAAEWGIKNGFTQYLLASAIGANAGASNFYLQLKGKLENAIETLQYPTTHIFRPSLLLGNRKEKRALENIMQVVMPVISILFPGKYKAIQGEDVAKAMLAASLNKNTRSNIYTYKDIISLAK